MYVHEGHRVGDAGYYGNEAGGEAHLFYLADPLDGGGGRFVGHAVSADLVRWERLPAAIRPGARGEWDDLQLCTGSVIAREGRYWLAYAATSTRDSSREEPWRVQRAGLAVSEDLVTWEKLPGNPVAEAGGVHYEEMSSGQRKMTNWRDPFLFEERGVAYQLVCARRRDGEVKTRGTVAVARSADMRSWEVLPPLAHDRIAEEMEVPQVYEIEGRWYLVFCTLGRFLSDDFKQRFGGECPERTNFSMVGESAFGPFHIHGTGQIVPHRKDEYLYAAQLVRSGGGWSLLATFEDEKGGGISDPVPVYGDATGVHGSR